MSEVLELENYDVATDDEFLNLMETHLDGIEAYDPKIGSTFKVYDLVTRDGKNLSAVIKNDVEVELSFSDDFLYLNDVLFDDVDYKNRRDLLTFINVNPDEVKTILEEKTTYLDVTKVKDGIINGSIMRWNKRNMYSQFRFQLDLYNKLKNMKSNQFDLGEKEVYESELRYYNCKIRDRNEGGYLGYIEGIQVFIPGSMAHNKKIEDYDNLLGETIPVMIENYAHDRDIYIVSFKRYIKYIIPDMLAELDRNEKIEGTITGVVHFGIFFNFKNYLNGLLHTSEMKPETYKKFKDGEFKNGDKLDFYIKSYTKKKIILTEQSFQEVKDNWDSLVERYEHQSVKLKAIKRVSSGFLFQLGDEGNTRGLLYDIEADKYDEKIEVGNEYQVYVDNMDFKSGKIYLKCPK